MSPKIITKDNDHPHSWTAKMWPLVLSTASTARKTTTRMSPSCKNDLYMCHFCITHIFVCIHICTNERHKARNVLQKWYILHKLCHLCISWTFYTFLNIFQTESKIDINQRINDICHLAKFKTNSKRKSDMLVKTFNDNVIKEKSIFSQIWISLKNPQILTLKPQNVTWSQDVY